MVIKRLKQDGGGGYSGTSRLRMGGPTNSRGIFRRGGQWRTIDRRDIRYSSRNPAGVSVGRGGVPVLKPGKRVPQLSKPDTGTATVTRPTLSEPASGENAPQVQEKLQVYDWEYIAGGRWNLKHPAGANGVFKNLTDAGAVQIAKELGIPAPPTAAENAVPKVTKTPTGGSMDLGDLLGKGLDLYSQYQQIKYAQPPQVSVQQPTIQTADFDWGIEPDIPFVDVVKKKRCRRRRRRLATKSDLGDLAALKAILGNGEAFKAWIATHSR